MDKQYYIKIKKQEIPVSEEVYRAYKRPVWREKKYAKIREDNEFPLSEVAELANSESAEDMFMRKWFLESIAGAITEMPDADRQIFIGSFIEGRSERDLSLQLHMPQKTIHNRKTAILKKLQTLSKTFL